VRLDHALHRLAAGQHGLASRQQCRDLGMRSREIDRLAGRGWRWLTGNVAAREGAPSTTGARHLAHVLDCGLDARLSHAAASEWWGLPGFVHLRPSVITTTRSRRPRELGDVHLVRIVHNGWTGVLDGIPIVRPELLMLHLCATEHRSRAERALDNAWSMRLLSGRSLIACVAQVGASGRNGTALLRELVERRGEDYIPPASNLERRAIEVLAPLGVDFRRQIDVGGHQWDGRVDLLASTVPLVVEVQSERFHAALLDQEADEVRRARLEADGYTVVEVTDVEVWTRPETVRSRVRVALRTLSRA
jgi:very-short-patch-repair endonuclease